LNLEKKTVTIKVAAADLGTRKKRRKAIPRMRM
jgi:hypothetical protein